MTESVNSIEASLEKQLFDLEEGFWLKGEDHFRANVDEQCLLAFPTMLEMHGVQPRERVAATAKHPNRWSDLEISDRQSLQPGSDVALISYLVSAKQADGKPYRALIGSAYVRRDDGWKLSFHQHSPIAEK